MMDSFLQYLGWYTVFIPFFLVVFGFLSFVFLYCKLKGPHDVLASILFYIPMICSLFLGVLLFYTSFFWITLGIYLVIFILVTIFSFKALAEALTDKTGMGVTMFSGLVSMYILTFCIILKFIVVLLR
ncbi:hypothetical protein [Flavobacterium sp. J27]|uniref:hypothetical protein n=1 Tax=Flavobacterium sp. J27 TaxID=2060419 RepID=UPI001030E709|nr:hypothetical protein [Flavobacterium sp. J27]